MAIDVRPATNFDDVKTMLGPKRADASVCWCLSYRLGSSKENRELTGPDRGERVKLLVTADTTSVLNGFPRVLMRLAL